ncbi:MAG: AAA family ATPase [Deltaproteobacteria bacterium HGW-Deltaproteobacteria-23]|nr:MAG: AAA family ATPase [Deltaproteobacteria bacterium HGW-Deltaproteobacteria-23]
MATKPAMCWQFEFRPIVLKELALKCDISQQELATSVAAIVGRNVSRTSMNLCINRGYLPRKIKGFKGALEQVIRDNHKAMNWLVSKDYEVARIWSPLGLDLRKAQLEGHGRRVSAHMPKAITNKETQEVAAMTWEVEMLHPGAMKLFKLFRHPFLNSVNSERDIFMSTEHRFAEMAMTDAAYNAGFIAIIGEVGSGKSTIRKKVVESLRREGGISIIEARNRRISAGNGIQSRINSVSLCDAIILDISGEKPQIRTEQKVRQVERLLTTRANQGIRHVLIIEEAHNLNPVALKYLKQVYELEDGYRKLLGIIMIGQPELKEMLDERRHVNMREVIRRVQIAEIKGIDEDLRAFIEFKFKRIGAKIESIITEDGIEALKQRLIIKDSNNQPISQAFPGLIENYIIRAMNLAFEFGESKVTAEVINAI